MAEQFVDDALEWKCLTAKVAIVDIGALHLGLGGARSILMIVVMNVVIEDTMLEIVAGTEEEAAEIGHAVAREADPAIAEVDQGVIRDLAAVQDLADHDPHQRRAGVAPTLKTTGAPGPDPVLVADLLQRRMETIESRFVRKNR